MENNKFITDSHLCGLIERKKMKELLEKYETRITTPAFENRSISFDGSDPEFSKWGYDGLDLHFEIRSGGRLKLSWDGTSFQGPDPRGGYSILVIEPSKLNKFREALKPNGSLEYKKPQEVEKNAEFATISTFRQPAGDTYKPEKDLKKQVDKLFEEGYNRIYILDYVANKNYFNSSNTAQDLLNCHFIKAEGEISSDSPLDLHSSEELSNWMIPKTTWLRIKGRVRKSNRTLTSGCQRAAKELGLKIYAFSKSRRQNHVPNDKTLKNFRLNNGQKKS